MRAIFLVLFVLAALVAVWLMIALMRFTAAF